MGEGGERGSPGEKGQKVFWRRENRNRKQDSQGGRKWENLQSKKRKEAGANKNRAGTGIKGYGRWEV